MRRALLLVLLLAVVVVAACGKATPTAPPTTPTPEVGEEVPFLDLAAELAFEAPELGELELSTLLGGSAEPGPEGLVMPELEVETSTGIVFDVAFEVEGTVE